MNLIVAVDKNWGIGKDNRLPWSIPSDMKFFREKTLNKVVVMGRKTLESFPNGLALPKRTNIVLSRNAGYSARGVICVHSVEELLKELKTYDTENVFVIGGAHIYEELLPYCDTAYVTQIDHVYETDASFPNLDKKIEWEKVYESEEQTCFDIEFTFTTYKNKGVA